MAKEPQTNYTPSTRQGKGDQQAPVSQQ